MEGFELDKLDITDLICKFRADVQSAILMVMKAENISWRELERRTGITRNMLSRLLTTPEGNPDLEQLVRMFDGVGYIARLTLERPVEKEET